MQQMSSVNAYYKGIKAFNNNDNITARYFLEQAYNNLELKKESLLKILNIDLKEGKYSKVRKCLKENEDCNDIRFKQIYGILENIENNFEASKQYYNDCMLDLEMQNKSLLAIAKLYIQTGDYDIARKMLETLLLNKKFYIQAVFGIISIDILEGKYEEGYTLLKTIDEKNLYPKILHHYRVLNMYLLYFMNDLSKINNTFDPLKDYMIYRLFDNSEDFLLENISKHLNQNERESNGCFFKYTNLKQLLYDAQDRISSMNANHFEFSDMYRFKLDTPIGFKGDEITSDLCVVTMLGTKEILTMYPVLLSDEFDREGMCTSKQLMIKRSRRNY